MNFGTGATQIRKILYNDTTTLYFMDTNYQAIDPWNNTLCNCSHFNAATPTNYVIESSVITVPTWTTNPDYTSRFVVLSGGIWYLSAVGSGAYFQFMYYDILMDAWYTRTTPTGLLIGAFGTRFFNRTNWRSWWNLYNGDIFGSGIGFCLEHRETLVVDRWRNYQVRITGEPESDSEEE